jgi:hypothetical protein
LKILSLKSALNRGLSKNTSEIQNILNLERPLHLVDSAEFKNIDPNWISGFVAGVIAEYLKKLVIKIILLLINNLKREVIYIKIK